MVYVIASTGCLGLVAFGWIFDLGHQVFDKSPQLSFQPTFFITFWAINTISLEVFYTSLAPHKLGEQRLRLSQVQNPPGREGWNFTNLNLYLTMRWSGKKKQRKLLAVVPVLPPRECTNAFDHYCRVNETGQGNQLLGKEDPEDNSLSASPSLSRIEAEADVVLKCPKFGMTSVCDWRRDMEDAVAIHPSFCGQNNNFGFRWC
ncbi:Protein-serine/threonine phosphatase [Forsythia ovata]|uniref:Protein-serine/threonine phosphatase n=1 Tax=Forsythia ovata TaxID=205694 RepID=A0ABD1XBP2_9LAMI